MRAEFKNCPVLVLAGGFGTRLQPIYNEGPKILAPVAGRPFLWYLLARLSDSGFRRVVVCTGYRSRQIEQWLEKFNEFDMQIECSREPQPLGTAGALRLAYRRYAQGTRFFALNGDSLFAVDFSSMYKTHLASGAAATVALAFVSDTSRYGTVEVDEQGRLSLFREKTAERRPGYINGGLYLFEPEVLDTVADKQKVSLETEILPRLVGSRLNAFKSDGFFIDIGIPQDFARAQSELKEFPD